MKHFYGPVMVLLFVLWLMPACGQLEEPLDVEETGIRAPDRRAGVSLSSLPTETVGLIAARNEDAGSVICWIEGDFLFIEYVTEHGWSLAETHCAVALCLDDIPRTPSENPKVGKFQLKAEHAPFSTMHTDSLNMEEWEFGQAEELIVAAHADVQILSSEGEVLRGEGAWGAGDPFILNVPADPHRIERPAESARDDLTKIPESRGGGNWATYFKVNVKKLKGLILWNELGSEHEVTHSRVGPDGATVGDIEYISCMHGNGFKPLPRTGDRNIPDNYIEFHGLDLGRQGCIEFWYHSDWSGWSVEHIVEFFCYGLPEDTDNLYIWMHFNDWQGKLNAVLWEPGRNEWAGMNPHITSIPEWTTAAPVHIAVTWDGTAPDVADRLHFYIDGSEIPDTYFYYRGDPTFEDWSSEAVFGLGSRIFSGNWDSHRWEGDSGVFDNIKIWSYPKTDFSDRFTE